MLTFALFWDRSGIDPTWIASGSGLRSVQDRSTVFPAEWERKHVLKAILLSSLPSLRVVLQVAKKCLQKRRTVQTRALIAAWARRIHDKRDESHRNADVYAGIAKAVKKQGLSWTWLEAGWKYIVLETSKSCHYQTRIFVSFSQLSGHKSTSIMKNFLEFLELSF